MMQQKAIRYWSEGIECAGTLYLPDTLMSVHKAPAVVLGHGTTYVKEMHVPHFARTFVDAEHIGIWGTSKSGCIDSRLLPLIG